MWEKLLLFLSFQLKSNFDKIIIETISKVWYYWCTIFHWLTLQTPLELELYGDIYGIPYRYKFWSRVLQNLLYLCYIYHPNTHLSYTVWLIYNNRSPPISIWDSFGYFKSFGPVACKLIIYYQTNRQNKMHYY